MSALVNNSLNGFLQVYAQESLQQYIAQMPKFNLFTKNFDTAIASGGTAVTTRISTTNWGTANDLTQGWATTGASSSAVTATLKLRDFDTAFDYLQFATLTEQVLVDTYIKPMVTQLANSITVDALSNVTSSYFTNTITVASSSLFTVTGSTSLQTGSTILDNLEIPFEGRFAIVSPNIYQTLVAGILPTYIYGNSGAVMDNNVQKLLNFDTTRYARFYGATKPQGGNSYGGGDKLVGILGHQQGLVAAVRAPLEINSPLVQSATVSDRTSGLSLQLQIINDISKPLWRFAVVSIYGTASANSSAIVPIITQSV